MGAREHSVGAGEHLVEAEEHPVGAGEHPVGAGEHPVGRVLIWHAHSPRSDLCYCTKPGLGVRACNSSTWEMEKEGFEAQGRP